ncbi:glycoside hydrolase family 97 catalytic domain-containing protein [Flavivirga aquimarina]|uniref:Glycoside hydrolase family 97 catalytic domain-containing protein n=1 Tax=Flavivirga aquimarina TaxID=2027862 RepID=A0ABT8W6G8_9FLAO|nr:glycoside hydrolase family 97 protein [Flavivirga aquimarina]MDO5968705.1 glycoside hydrolase family 97 catalytic domain-containing protein [Flavivirga aquimarina]
MFKKIKYNLVLLVLIATINACDKKDTNFSVSSSDGHVTVKLINEKGKITYALFKDEKELIKSSEISILPYAHTEIKGTFLNSENKTWQPVWGQFSEVKNEYNELVLNLLIENVTAKLYVRVFNKGVGFRYELEDYKEGVEANFYCEYNLNNNDALYAPNGERSPLGPITIEKLTKLKKQPKLMTPLVVEKSEKNHLSILESDLYVAPEFGTIKFKFLKDKKALVSTNTTKLKGAKIKTPWRVILIEEQIGDLVTNTIPLNLATANQIEDASWIKPGKTLWDWRVHDYKTEDGFVYGINTESYVRFIDFAAEKGIEYFLIDANWFTKVTKGHFEITDKLDLEKVSNYAKESGVKLILYYDRHKGDYGDEGLFSYFKSLGMSGIKYGFMGNNVSFTSDAIQKSAKNHLLVNFHDSPVPFTGIERTFPNAITREYCHAQQDSRRAFTPESFIKMALINAIQGPLDMNNGNFDLIGINRGDRQKGPKKPNSYYATVVSEAARTLIIFSGLVCLPDAPEAYNKKSDLFEFIEKMPVGKWDESMVVNSKMDAYISTARRYKEEWFIGSVTNKQERTLDIDLDFLKDGKTYVVTYYEDTEETHGMKNPEAYQVRTGKVKKGDIIKAIMAPGGGHCMWIRPE